MVKVVFDMSISLDGFVKGLSLPLSRTAGAVSSV